MGTQNKQSTRNFAQNEKHIDTTQLFINFENNARLDSMGFAPIGKVVGSGIGVRPKGRYSKRDFPELSQIMSVTMVSLRSDAEAEALSGFFDPASRREDALDGCQRLCFRGVVHRDSFPKQSPYLSQRNGER